MDQETNGQSETTPRYEAGGWAAHYFPDERKVYVGGNVTLPTPGYEVELSADVNQGINPREALRLEIVARPPSGMVTQVITEEPVQYEREVGEEGPPWPRVRIINADPPASIEIQTAGRA
jgi:acyl-coenzyme A synthetase/AMP-(fatty) acid ligase